MNGPVTTGNFALLHPLDPSFKSRFARPAAVFPEHLIVRDRIYDRSLMAIRSQTPAPARPRMEWVDSMRALHNGLSRMSAVWDPRPTSKGPRSIPSGGDALGPRFLAGAAAGSNGPNSAKRWAIV